MRNLIQFVLARVAEDEGIAEAARADGYSTEATSRIVSEIQARHVATFSPERIIEECALKRLIVRMEEKHAETIAGLDRPLTYEFPYTRVLAMGYRNHPDFQPLWLQ